MDEQEPITADMLIWAYSHGVFPMADSRHGPVNWYSAEPRAILPLERFRTTRSLRQRIRRGDYDIRVDIAFQHVMCECAQPRRDHPDTWISDQIIDGYTRLHEMGMAHSVEAWGPPQADGTGASENRDGPAARNEHGHVLLGGLYGVTLGGAFFGESMFSRAKDASKVCLVHLIEHLRDRGFVLLDVQMNSSHMARFGTIEVSRQRYMELLEQALGLDVSW